MKFVSGFTRLRKTHTVRVEREVQEEELFVSHSAGPCFQSPSRVPSSALGAGLQQGQGATARVPVWSWTEGANYMERCKVTAVKRVRKETCVPYVSHWETDLGGGESRKASWSRGVSEM